MRVTLYPTYIQLMIQEKVYEAENSQRPAALSDPVWKGFSHPLPRPLHGSGVRF